MVIVDVKVWIFVIVVEGVDVNVLVGATNTIGVVVTA